MTGSSVRVYVDSSALIKRVVEEPESDQVEVALGRYVTDRAALVSSTLAWVEVTRAIQTRLDGADHEEINEAVEVALSGIAERPMTADVVSLARRVRPSVLRSLDAIHLATAVLLDVDVVIAYDQRLMSASRENGIAVLAPGTGRR